MAHPRSVSSTEAKATLGELLASLASDGPVDITRNGRRIAVLAAGGETAPAAARQLAALAPDYSAGRIPWRSIAAETGAAYGELLAELARQGLAVPRVRPSRRPAQDALFEQVLRQAGRP